MNTQDAATRAANIDEFKKSTEIAEALFHRAKFLVEKLPPDSLVGTNNIVAYLRNLIQDDELISRCFKKMSIHITSIQPIDD